MSFWWYFLPFVFYAAAYVFMAGGHPYLGLDAACWGLMICVVHAVKRWRGELGDDEV